MDEDDLNWVTFVKNIVIIKTVLENYCRSKTIKCKKLGHFSEIQNDALMHREGLKD